MMKNIYVKKVIIVLKDKLLMYRFDSLTEKLGQEGISVHFQSELLQDAQTLYITDCNETAAFLKARNLPVLGFLHEGGDSLTGINYLMESPEDVDARYLDRVYRRCQNIPWDILETKRCTLRETTVEDVDGFYEIYHHPDIIKYTEDLYPEKEQERAYIQDYIDKVYRYFEFGVWTVLLKETGEIIGRAGFSVREGYELPELGFVIGVPWQGKGLAYEICSAILEYGKEEYDFNCVQTLVAPGNAASLALCRKLGFKEQERVLEKEKEYILMTKKFRN